MENWDKYSLNFFLTWIILMLGKEMGQQHYNVDTEETEALKVK